MITPTPTKTEDLKMAEEQKRADLRALEDRERETNPWLGRSQTRPAYACKCDDRGPYIGGIVCSGCEGER